MPISNTIYYCYSFSDNSGTGFHKIHDLNCDYLIDYYDNLIGHFHIVWNR
jgi:hypothetical protein